MVTASRREIGNGKEEAGGWEEAGDGLMGMAERAGEDGRRWRGLEWMIGELEERMAVGMEEVVDSSSGGGARAA